MKIVIDAGHNDTGYDTGAEGNGLREQDITFSVAHMVAEKLKKFGVEVKETRPTKATNLGTSLNESLQARCDMANSVGADLFVSLHCNSFIKPGPVGTETYVYQKGGEAEKLAEKVQKHIVRTVGTIDRGVKEQNLYVLRKTNMPAILIELAYICTPSDAEKLKTKQAGFAEAIAYGIREYLKLEEAEMTKTEAKEILKAVLSEETITYLDSYRYGDELIIKLAKAIRGK